MPNEMMYVVDGYCDRINRKKVSEDLRTFCGSDVWPRRFETEDQAKLFIIDRAERGVIEAAIALDKAKARERKCDKKFWVVE